MTSAIHGMVNISDLAARFPSSLALCPNYSRVFVPWGSEQLYFVDDPLRLGYFVLDWQASGSDLRSLLDVTSHHRM